MVRPQMYGFRINYNSFMRKLIIVLVAMLAAVMPAFAEFRWGPQIGYNYSDFHWKQDLVTSKGSSGFQAGLAGEVMIPGIGFGIDFGLLYSMHGGKVNFGERPVWSTDGFGDEMIRLHQLSIPFHIRFKYTRFGGFERVLAPFVYAGPSFDFTVGHSKHTPLEFPAGSIGIQVGLGAEIIRHLQISAGYTWGVTYEMRTLKLDNFSARSQRWNVNVAWFF